MRRNKFQLIASVLESAKTGIKITDLMLSSKTSYSQLRRVLDVCLDAKLLRAHEKQKSFSYKSGSHKLLTNKPKSKKFFIYQTIPKGLLFVQKVRELEELLK